LGVEPAQETTQLYEQIRTGQLNSPEPLLAAQPDLTVRPPRFLEDEPPQVDTPIFVARERELTQLDGILDLAMTGQGRVAFVTGEAGSGKTALVQEFSRRSRRSEPAAERFI
jgi:Cdc6-like AAA superfamily ATPase